MKVFVFLYIGLLKVGLRKCIKCPPPYRPGLTPPSNCTEPYDPQNRPASALESWFTEEVFNDLFPKANLGWGVSNCRPYNYKSFIIAARYFPSFGNEYVTNDPTGKPLPTKYSPNQTFKRDLAAFFAHTIQEIGENDADLYQKMPKAKADDCFYRGGFYNWFEGGPLSSLVKNNGLDPKDGEFCNKLGEYCDESTNNKWFYPCYSEKQSQWSKGCYMGRGPLQISYNFNYGLFSRWLQEQNITEKNAPIDILANPNLLMTKYDPPIGIMSSLWFYMTPQSPKPAMHDIVIGDWVSPDVDYSGGVFGPTSLVINSECGGEDKQVPGGPGENRRIKAFRWFTKYFGVPFNSGLSKTISCKEFNNGSESFDFHDGRIVENTWDADWTTSWQKTKPCECKTYPYSGNIFAFDSKIMPKYKKESDENKKWCERIYQEGYNTQKCSQYKPIKQLAYRPVA